MDGRRNNTGTKGNKGGRPPKADEIKLIEQLDKYIDPELAFETLNKLMAKDNLQALKLYFEYRHGKPKETKDINLTSEQPFFP